MNGKFFCSLCNKDLEYKNGGFYDPKRHVHAQTESHKVSLQASQAQPSIRKAATKQDNLSVQVTNTELQVAHFLASHQLPMALADDFVSFLAKACPDSAIAKQLRSGRTRTTAGLHVIASHMHNDLVFKMRQQFFSIMPDETTDIAVAEQAAFAARINDVNRGCSKTHFYVHKSAPNQRLRISVRLSKRS